MDIVEYTELLVRNLVMDADMIKVEAFENDDEPMVLEIMVPEHEMKYVIGKSGKNAQALRTLINAYGYIHGLKKKVKINISAF